MHHKLKELIDNYSEYFDFSKFDYLGSKTKSIIICKKCNNEYLSTPSNIKMGSKCSKCRVYKKFNINDLDKIFSQYLSNNWKIDYDTFIDYKSDINLICPNNHIVKTKPRYQNDNSKKVECKECISKDKIILNNLNIINSINTSILEVECKLCNNKYCHHINYLKSNKFKCAYCDLINKCALIRDGIFTLIDIDLHNEYPKSRKVLVKCNNNHLVRKSIDNLVSGKGCNECRKNTFISEEQFIDKYKSIFPYNKYINGYISMKSKCIFECEKGHIYNQYAYNTLQGKGCTYCKESKGERNIKKFLIEKNIKFKQQQTFPNCLSDNNSFLRFDFYLPEYNICIEYDGEQHFSAIKYFGGEESYNRVVINDSIKNDYCNNKGIYLIRIPYYNFNKINIILSEICMK